MFLCSCARRVVQVHVAPGLFLRARATSGRQTSGQVIKPWKGRLQGMNLPQTGAFALTSADPDDRQLYMLIASLRRALS